MDTFISFLIDLGYPGMLLSAFLAGSFLPFNSEIVMAGLQLTGKFELWYLVAWGTIGNTAGGAFNYYVGHLGKKEWIYKHLHIKPSKLKKSEDFVERYGAWMGLLGWIPILGSAITVALGILRVNPWLSILTMAIGKLARYIIVVEIALHCSN